MNEFSPLSRIPFEIGASTYSPFPHLPVQWFHPCLGVFETAKHSTLVYSQQYIQSITYIPGSVPNPDSSGFPDSSTLFHSLVFPWESTLQLPSWWSPVFPLPPFPNPTCTRILHHWMAFHIDTQFDSSLNWILWDLQTSRRSIVF